MNALTILLTTLASVFSLVGVAPEVVLEQTLRDQLEEAETLVVRVDSIPNHQLLQGRVDRLRLAGRGLYPVTDVRIDTFDLETDPIDLNMAALRQGRVMFDEPFQAAFNLVVTQEDIDRALRSPLVIKQLETISINVLGNTMGQMDQAVLKQPEITLLDGDRLQFAATLIQKTSNEQLTVQLTTGLAVDQGTRLKLVDPQLTANNVDFPLDLVESTIDGLSQQYSLTALESQGITARILQLHITADQLGFTSFVRVVPQ